MTGVQIVEKPLHSPFKDTAREAAVATEAGCLFTMGVLSNHCKDHNKVFPTIFYLLMVTGTALLCFFILHVQTKLNKIVETNTSSPSPVGDRIV